MENDAFCRAVCYTMCNTLDNRKKAKLSSKEVAKFADEAMFVAEEAKKTKHGYRPVVKLLDAPSDPLGKLAYIAKAYQGKFLGGYSDITDEDRRYYIQDMEKNILGMPSEAIQFHFVLENVTRSFTHQLVRTRHACLTGDTRVMGGSYHSNRNGHNPTLKDLYENRKVAGGTKQVKIRTVNESGIIVRNRIKDIWEVGVREVFELKTHDGRAIKATGNHPFQRPDGTFTNLEDLSVGDRVMSNGVELVTDQEWLADKIDRGMSTQAIADLANCSTSHVKKYRRKFGISGVGGFASISPEQRRINSSIAGSTPQKKWSPEARARFSEQCKRERNKGPENYSGIDPGHRQAQAMFAHKYEEPCAWCGGKSEELAHVDGNPMNNSDKNVQGMCVPCHRAMDRGTYPESVYPSTIVSIEPAGFEMVYDLEMEGDYPWFVANGLVVHNSYAQESMRFAVKEDFPVQLPPSLLGTMGREEWREREVAAGPGSGSGYSQPEENWLEYEERYASDKQRMRFKWDEAVADSGKAYLDLIEAGMPAEDARGLAPHAIVTKINWVVDLRALMATAGQRLCTQAQWEHREMWNSLILSIRGYGKSQTYDLRQISDGDPGLGASVSDDGERVHHFSSYWQFELLADRFKPVCYQTGRCQFRSDFDRYCNIRDRVEAFAANGVPSSEWADGASIGEKYVNDPEKGNDGFIGLGIPKIGPTEWMHPNAAIRQDAEWRSEEALDNIKERR